MRPRQSQRIAIIGALVLGVFAVVGWQAYNGGRKGSILSARAQAAVTSYEDQIREIDIATQRFQSVQLDVAFLSSPEFRSLKDYSVVIPRPISVGRINPFEPLPEANSSDQLPTRDESILPEDGAPEALEQQATFEFDSSVFDNLNL